MPKMSTYVLLQLSDTMHFRHYDVLENILNLCKIFPSFVSYYLLPSFIAPCPSSDPSFLSLTDLENPQPGGFYLKVKLNSSLLHHLLGF